MTRARRRIKSVTASDRWRSSQFLVLGLIFGFLAYDPKLDLIHVLPGLQDDMHSFAVLCLRGTLGYWFARICLARVPHTINAVTSNHQAVILGFTILARAVLIGMALVSFK